jgi:hypothetical protein
MMAFPSAQVTILLQTFDSKGVIRCLVDEKGYFGVTVEMDHQYSPTRFVKKVIKEKLSESMLMDEHVEIISLVDTSFKKDGLSATMLFLVKISPDFFTAPDQWPSFISHLKQLQPGRERNAYNKAFQYFAGAHLDDVNAVEIDQTVLERLRKMDCSSE